VARWAAKGTKKNCKDCKKLANPDSFQKGVRVRIAGVMDCENCEVTKSQPIESNENIIELYNALPENYDGFSGLRIISATDIKFVLELWDVSEGLWDGYYTRLLYFHTEYMRKYIEERKAEREFEAWRKKGLQNLKSRRVH